MNISELDNTFVGSELGDIGRLRQIASKFCPEEISQEVRQVIPDSVDTLDLSDIEAGFRQLLAGGSGFPNSGFPQFSFPDVDGSNFADDNPGTIGQSVKNDGFGIGIPETESVSRINYEDTDTISTSEIRKDFPVLQKRVNGHPLVWFDNGATTQKPRQVIDAISDYYSNYNSNIHRGAHTLAAQATDAYEGAREKVRKFINASSAEEIIFVRGTTEGINLVAQTFGRKFVGVGDEVIVSTLDHHANIVPWQQICKEKGAKLRAIPINECGDLILEDYERMIGSHTKFVSVGHVNNTFGTINDVRRIIEVAHRYNVPVLIDGAQSIAHTKVDVQALGADFFVFSGRKIYAPTGIGVVYGRKDLLDILPPWQGGGNMIKDVPSRKPSLMLLPPALRPVRQMLPMPLAWVLLLIM